MPWCTSCDRFLTPSTVRADGSCPACGRAVSAPSTTPVRRGRDASVLVDEDEDLGPVPWHLKLLAGAVAVYLGYRTLPLLDWLGRQL